MEGARLPIAHPVRDSPSWVKHKHWLLWADISIGELGRVKQQVLLPKATERVRMASDIPIGLEKSDGQAVRKVCLPY